MAAGRAGAEPLRVADDKVVGIAMGVELGERLGLEIGPRRRLDGNLDAGFLFILVAEFLQIIGRIPLRPEDGEFLVLRVNDRCSAGER